jgi:uncharacterized protein (TIGR03083 family)
MPGAAPAAFPQTAQAGLMDREESWRVITEQRLGLARLLEGLSDDEWEQPSLCAGWRVRDVAAHVSLVTLPPSPGTLLRDLIRARGSFHRLNTLVTQRRAEARAKTANCRSAPARWPAQNPHRV